MPLETFHPAVAAWFRSAFEAPTPAQAEAWPAIASGRHTLIAAPTGSGKTLAAFLAAIDDLVRRGVDSALPDETAVVYVSPLKALSNDVRINLETPLAGIRDELLRLWLPDVEIRTMVRTGDTPQADRDRMRKRPPHIVVTTPESLYILLGSESGRRMLSTTRTVIVDEIHALAPNKRGAHLALSLERLDELCERRLVRIGLSATQKPIGEVARFLIGGPPRETSAGAGAQPLETLTPDSTDSWPRETLSPNGSIVGGEGRVRGRGSKRSVPLDDVEESAGFDAALFRYSDVATSSSSAPSPQPSPPTMELLGERESIQQHVASLGEREPSCKIVDAGHVRPRDLAIELPEAPLEAVMSGDAWQQVHARLEQLIGEHHTTLIFVNTRRMAERLARHLSERLGKDKVTAHHGSMAKEQRFDAEQRLKRGDLSALVATASLELGIDIGDVDLVCQIGSPRAIATFLQRVGRASHHVSGTPKGRLFPQSRDELVECTALLDAVRRGELDTLHVERAPLDVLAQQIVAEVACREWKEDALFDLVRRAHPFSDITREQFGAVVRMLAEGFTTRRGPRSAWLHRDAVHGVLRASRGARLTAITSGGAIPDTADYEVVLEPQATMIGSVHEDFAVESIAGDIFQLGNQSYRILRVERGRVRVEDAQGAPPTIPFWLGEAPGRSDELSFAVSRLRREISDRLEAAFGRSGFSRDALEAGDVLEQKNSIAAEAAPTTAQAWLIEEVGIAEPAARQIVDYLGSAKAALGVLPTHETLAMERFFDESGGTQLIIHSPFGSRINRAWGLALRKRFCRKFNFELQAAATEDAIVLSLSTSHSFPLEDVTRYLHSASVRDVLIQALLDAPMFGVRWRWNATSALALPRFQGGSKVPPQLQRMKAEDLLATVFPDQVACAENLVGEREIPDHPLVEQTLHDCLHGAMDIDGLVALLKRLEEGSAYIVARDLTGPSPLAAEVLGARPYSFLDDAPLEERRTQAVASRRWSDPESVDDLGRLDPDAIAAVREEAWPEARSSDELHAALMGVAFIAETEARATYGWSEWLAQLAADQRVTRLAPVIGTTPKAPVGAASAAMLLSDVTGKSIAAEAAPTNVAAAGSQAGEPYVWIPAERLPQFEAILPDALREPAIDAPAEYAAVEWTREDALIDVLRARMTALGPTRASEIAASLGIAQGDVGIALLALESEGFVMRGQFTTMTSAADSAQGGADEPAAPVAGSENVARLGRDRFAAGRDRMSDPAAKETEWCERHLLARIHRYTVKRLRREIEPVEPRDFMRFLFEWQRIAPGSQVSGPDALAGVLAQLEGFEAAASAWESEILPARVAGYEIAWLDALCQAGREVWTRLRGRSANGERGGGPVRATPIVLLQRRHLDTWTQFGGLAAGAALTLSSRAQAVADHLSAHGASFFDELLSGTRLLHTELEDALGELVAIGLINADSFSGLRALLVPSSKRPSTSRRHGRRRALFGIEDAGRWSLVRRRAATVENDQAGAPASPRTSRDKFDADALEHVARVLLKRYGVVCWRMLAHEADWLPPWRDLLRVYHRLEARGEIRGGRFVAGISGEQFALPEAIASLRSVRQRAPDQTLVCVCGADPLNLVGSLLAGEKVPRLTGSRVLYRDGVPVAKRVAGQTSMLESMDATAERVARTTLLRGMERPRSPVEHGEEE
ncbi:DEAD/DEAH box helicase [Dokdonella soli]|uniref:DEAD/DEAH box helicase n=1 Tax=Dokdonella soli TaxID=529810 RepID=UPI00360B0E26